MSFHGVLTDVNNLGNLFVALTVAMSSEPEVRFTHYRVIVGEENPDDLSSRFWGCFRLENIMNRFAG